MEDVVPYWFQGQNVCFNFEIVQLYIIKKNILTELLVAHNMANNNYQKIFKLLWITP